MINQDGECKTLTDKSISHKKAKFMNSDRQTDRQTHRQQDRQIERQANRQKDRPTDSLTDSDKSRETVRH